MSVKVCVLLFKVTIMEQSGGLAVVLSLLRRGFDPWPGNFFMLQVGSKKKKKRAHYYNENKQTNNWEPPSIYINVVGSKWKYRPLPHPSRNIKYNTEKWCWYEGDNPKNSSSKVDAYLQIASKAKVWFVCEVKEK